VAAENGADGVGLYRLEALFMLHKTLPSEQQLLTEISDTLAPLEDKPAIVRLLDVGSDKHLPYFEFAAEPAPCLGMRGVRILLAHPELLKVQLRALLRLSQARDVRIMVPMVTVSEDMRAVQQAVEAQASELGIAKIPPLIAMIETPAAALCVPDILQFADALSLGTNDLTQYTMAAGRQNPLVHRYFQDDHPAVLRLIRLAAGEAGNALVAVCGELAGRPDAVPVLLEAGVRLLSVAPPLVPMIKRPSDIRVPGSTKDKTLDINRDGKRLQMDVVLAAGVTDQTNTQGRTSA
jgi:phosphotransferase system enzyme I (PtsI)